MYHEKSAEQKLYELQKREPCEDCVSREDAFEAFGLSENTRKYGGDRSGYNTLMLYEIQDIIEDLPSVQPKRVECDNTISLNIRQLIKEMREATQEEQDGVSNYINSIAIECEDAISREEAIRCCRNEWEEEVEERLRALLPVQPKQRTGHWIDEGFYAEGHSHHAYRCSECGFHIIRCADDKPLYCESCGSKMEEGE